MTKGLDMNEENLNPSVWRYVLAYLFWAVSVVLSVVNLLVWRISLTIALGMTAWDRYFEHAINQFGFLILAIVVLAVMVGVEHYYRTGVPWNRLLERFLLVTFWEVAFLALAHALRSLGEVVLDLPTSSLLLVFIEIVGCVLLFWLYRQAKNRRSI